jgi:predicted ArsR family transcriptional regulator
LQDNPTQETNVTQTEALKQIATEGPVAIGDIPASRNTVLALRERKLIKKAGVRHTGTRGRPAKLYEVSAKGKRQLERA